MAMVNKPDEFKNRISRIVIKLIGELGFNELEISQIKDEIEVSESELFASYSSLEEIKYLVVKRSFETFFDFLNVHYGNPEKKQAELKTFWQAVVHFSNCYPEETFLFLRCFKESEALDYYNLKKELHRGIPDFFQFDQCLNLNSNLKCLLLFRYIIQNAVELTKGRSFEYGNPHFLKKRDLLYESQIINELHRLRSLPFK